MLWDAIPLAAVVHGQPREFFVPSSRSSSESSSTPESSTSVSGTGFAARRNISRVCVAATWWTVPHSGTQSGFSSSEKLGATIPALALGADFRLGHVVRSWAEK
jgi:hypothetical protein